MIGFSLGTNECSGLNFSMMLECASRLVGCSSNVSDSGIRDAIKWGCSISQSVLAHKRVHKQVELIFCEAVPAGCRSFAGPRIVWSPCAAKV